MAVLEQLFVDVTTRGLEGVTRQLQDMGRQAEGAIQNLRRMKNEVENVERVQGRSGSRQRGNQNQFGQLLQQAAPYATAGGIVAGVTASVKAADPYVFEQIGRVMHDLAGTVGQLVAPAFRAFIPILRTIADTVAGVADAFAPFINLIRGEVVGVVGQLVGVWQEAAGSLAGIFLPVLSQLAELVGPLGQIFVSLYQALLPLNEGIMAMQGLFVSVVAALVKNMVPGLTVLAEVLGVVGTVTGEVVRLFADLGGMLLAEIQTLIGPIQEIAQTIAVYLVAGLRLAVEGFKALIESIRALFGLTRIRIAAGDSRGRGLVGATGTEDAQSTFQRLQQAVLKAGQQDDGKEKEELKRQRALETLFRDVSDIAKWFRDRANDLNKLGVNPGAISEGAKRGLDPVLTPLDIITKPFRLLG